MECHESDCFRTIHKNSVSSFRNLVSSGSGDRNHCNKVAKFRCGNMDGNFAHCSDKRNESIWSRAKDWHGGDIKQNSWISR